MPLPSQQTSENVLKEALRLANGDEEQLIAITSLPLANNSDEVVGLLGKVQKGRRIAQDLGGLEQVCFRGRNRKHFSKQILSAYDDLAGIQWEWQAVDGVKSHPPLSETPRLKPIAPIATSRGGQTQSLV